MDKSAVRFRRAWVYLLLVVVGVSAAASAEEAQDDPYKPKMPRKRQIYREAVLPARGGVIPTGAFTKQRLKHNVHDQLGVEAPDGVVFIARKPTHMHPLIDPEDDKEILRLVPKINPFDPPTRFGGDSHLRPLPTTYLIRRPARGRVYVPDPPRFRSLPPSSYRPTYHWNIQPSTPHLHYKYTSNSYK